MAEDSAMAKIEQVLLTGDLAKLNPDERVAYYNRVCQSLDLNPLTKPFDYLTLNGKMRLYATKDCTDQLRKRDSVSVRIVSREVLEGVFIVTAEASLPNGRVDSDTGAVPLDKMQGEARANAMMKAITKAKRRVTLSICGLGMLDESEVESVPAVRAGSNQESVKALPDADPEPNDPPDAAVVEEIIGELNGCRYSEDAFKLAERVKSDKRITDAGRNHLRPLFGRAIKELPKTPAESVKPIQARPGRSAPVGATSQTEPGEWEPTDADGNPPF